jgi:hypothetical protein
MPYIPQSNRQALREGKMSPQTPGELNYVITKAVHDYITRRGGVSYAVMNEVHGVLACATTELYLTVTRPYEEAKRQANGSVSNHDAG